ncbi:Tripartite motif-containing protein 65 [Liparis tanakae]|uniref:Tripartite motif-containing protein 65 n=1 Tax=Liparis tanakae TaxID=230148 RepID=A0A4Z2GJM2_9TELE|nr:Tripartite motif-containing protein 65 [Liparis tanakae]
MNIVYFYDVGFSRAANMALPVPVEEQFKCCICLDIFTDPTSIPCGHNFCLYCIEGYWDTRKACECPLCKETFGRRPKLRINLGYAEIIEIYKRFVIEYF